MRERALEKDDLIDELRERIRVLEDELHEYHMRERITSLVRYSETNPEMVMQRLLGISSSASSDVNTVEDNSEQSKES